MLARWLRAASEHDIVFVGYASAELGNDSVTGSYAVDLTSLTGGADTFARANDLVLVNAGTTTTISAISGYTSLVNQSETADTNDCAQRVAYKFMPSTPDATVTIPKTTGAGSENHGNGATVQVWRNVSQVSPTDATTTVATGTNTGRPDCPSITPITAGCVIVACGVGSANLSSALDLSAPSGMTNFAAISSGGAPNTNDVRVAMASLSTWTSGAYNPAPFGGGSSSTNDSWCAATVVLRPA